MPMELNQPPVRLTEGARTADDAGWPAGLDALAATAAECAAHNDPIDAARGLVTAGIDRIPTPGGGSTRGRWAALATLGAVDLTVARALEPHLDALAILGEAGRPGDTPTGLLGVYAAEGPGHRLTARVGSVEQGEAVWLLSGSKPWCSLADRVGGFLVTAWVDERRRGLFLVDRAAVDAGRMAVETTPWHARGLTAVHSPTTRYDDVPAVAVGGPGWYIERPGFAWGGMGVAAVWFGGAVAVARRILDHARGRAPDQIALMHIGRVEAAVHRARCVLAAAADAVDDGSANGAPGARLALTVRQVVRHGVEDVLTEAAHAMGPAPLVHDAEHARRVADLQVYIRQEHAARDAAALGRAVLEDS